MSPPAQEARSAEVDPDNGGAGTGMVRRGNLPQRLAGATRSAARRLAAALQRRPDASRQFGKSVPAGLACRSAVLRGAVSESGPADDRSRGVADRSFGRRAAWGSRVATGG